MSDTEKKEDEAQEPVGGAGFGTTVIIDELVTVIRHPNNVPKEEKPEDA